MLHFVQCLASLVCCISIIFLSGNGHKVVYQQKKAQRVVIQRVHVTTKLAIAAVTSAATTVPSLLPSPPQLKVTSEPDGSCASVSSPSPNSHHGELSCVFPRDLEVNKPQQLHLDLFPVQLSSGKKCTFASVRQHGKTV